MKKFALAKNIISILIIIFISITVFLFLFYFLILPSAFNSKKAVDIVEKIANKKLDIQLTIENQKLKTSAKPEIELKIGNFLLSKNNKKLIELEDFEFNFSFSKIFEKKIELKKLSAKNLNLDINKIIEIFPTSNESKSSQKCDFNLIFNEPTIKLDKAKISYLEDKTLLNIDVDNLKLNNKPDFKSIEFILKVQVKKDKKDYLNITSQSKDEVKLLKDGIIVENLDTLINNSKLTINSELSANKLFLNATSTKFNLNDIFNIINSNLIIPNGEAMLLPLKNPKGAVEFDISLLNEDLFGDIIIENTGAQLKDVSNLPINITSGKINITKDKINFLNLVGYYGKNKKNKIEIKGDIKDYYKTFNSNIEIESIITNEFFKDYLAPLMNNTALFVSKPSKTKIIYKSKNNIMDIIWFAQIDKGINFGISDEKSALSDYDRAVLGEFQIKDDKFEIKNINYYIAQNIVRGVKLQPILVFSALMDFSGKLDNIGLAFGREMPCEFLNIFIGQKLFKKGTIKGDIHVAFKNDIPYLDANMEINKTIIPSQRTFIKKAILKTNDNTINIDTKGAFKRAKFDFKGKIKNELKPPFIIKNLTLNIDNIDIERFLASMNNQNQNLKEKTNIESESDIQDDNFIFDTNLIRIEDCNFSLEKGNYKDLTFGNIKANLTLDENGILNINSNKFDIAQGISTLKVIANLKDITYYLRLGIKDIDSNLMAKTLFNLDKEISGKASGLIELQTDRNLKLNGDIKFMINDGTIGKIGLVEYLLKIASVFRNPIVMISPATIMDIVSIPEGKFDKITGTIKMKDNILSMINIKSYSSSLSALIRGRFDLERHDASLRIYTRFSTDKKSMFNVLRQISLNKLANKVKLNSRNDANYYASELKDLPAIEIENEKTQIFLTQVEGDIEHFNFLSSLKKIK